MLSHGRLTLCLIAALGAAETGCVATQRDMDALEKRVQQAQAETTALRADLEATRQRLDNALRANADSSSDVMSTRQRVNDLGGRFDEVQHGLEELKREVTASRAELYARMDEMQRAQASAATAAPAAAAAPVVVPATKDAHFAQLRDAHGKRDWTTVRALGSEYVNRYPTDDRAGEALYLVGDADLTDGRPSSALGHYNRILKLFPRSTVLDKTLFAMGEAYMMMHDCANAKLAYEACEKRFTKDKIGADARAKLATIAKNAPGLCAPQ